MATATPSPKARVSSSPRTTRAYDGVLGTSRRRLFTPPVVSRPRPPLFYEPPLTYAPALTRSFPLYTYPPSALEMIPPDVLDCFSFFDRNRSGFLDFHELREALRHYGIDTSLAGAIDLLRRYDDYPDGKLDVYEFSNLVRDPRWGRAAGCFRPSSQSARPDQCPA